MSLLLLLLLLLLLPVKDRNKGLCPGKGLVGLKNETVSSVPFKLWQVCV